MKQKAAKILDVAIHSINLLLINYALSNMMALFRSSVLYILFFTSEMWVFAQYRKSIETLSNSKTLANLLLVICAAIEIGLLYFIGIVSGKLVATVYKGNIIKNLIMDCQSYTKYRPNETTGGIFVSWRRKEELPTGA